MSFASEPLLRPAPDAGYYRVTFPDVQRAYEDARAVAWTKDEISLDVDVRDWETLGAVMGCAPSSSTSSPSSPPQTSR